MQEYTTCFGIWANNQVFRQGGIGVNSMHILMPSKLNDVCRLAIKPTGIPKISYQRSFF
jgi:hypothetical protein